MPRIAGNQTRVSIARPETVSIRTTIPAFIANQMGLKVGDALNWELDKEGDLWVAKFSRAGE